MTIATTAAVETATAAASTTAPAPKVSRCPFARLFGGASASLATGLRERTREAHARAEKHPLQSRLVTGRTTRAEYAAWLVQLEPIWIALDAGLRTLAQGDPRVASMLRPYHTHAPRIAADLRYLGVEEGPRAAVTPAAKQLAQWVEAAAQRRDPALVGVWYVLEGSTNGGRFIARALAAGLDIPGPEGLRSQDPHGEAQRERWTEWRDALDAGRWGEGERVAIIDAAQRTFETLGEVMEEMERDAVVRVHA
ncbi:MAG: biliverdin-producing heme oxygenase [Phycisphaerales bacterium]